VVYGAPAAQAVVKEASDIPVVFAAVPDPQAMGIGGRLVTGISSKMQLAGNVKNLKSMKDFSSLGVVYNSSEKDTVAQMEEVARLEGQFGFKSIRLNLKGPADAGKIKGVEALFVTTSCVANQCITGIAKAARALGVPTATTVSGGEGAGIILTVSPSAEEQGAQAAEMAAKILKGVQPSAIKLEQPRKIDIVVNLKEANSMGIKVPIDLLSAATQVIK
jgi:putative ABC transport system substrate-binding protein